MPKPSIADRLAHARQAEYLSWDDCALLLSVSKATVRRRQAKIAAVNSFAILKEGRTVRIARSALFRVFRRVE